MGINKENLLSDEHHASHFSCAICQDLSESPVTLACSHAFCEFCIGEYVARCLDRQQNALCPDVPRGGLFVGREALGGQSTGVPLLLENTDAAPPPQAGLRLDGRLGSLQGHLTNSDSHLQKGMSQGDVYDALKREGDERYRARAYDQAAELYSKAAAVAPERAQAFANRAACRLMAHRPRFKNAPVTATRRCGGTRRSRTRDAARAGFARVGPHGGCSKGPARLGAGDERRPGRRRRGAPRRQGRHRRRGRPPRLRRRRPHACAGVCAGQGLRDAESAPVVLGAAAAELGLGKIDRRLRLRPGAPRRADAARWRPLCARRAGPPPCSATRARRRSRSCGKR